MTSHDEVSNINMTLTDGNPKKLPITEKTPTVPINPYGKAKLYAEVAIKDFQHANPVGLGKHCSPRHRMPVKLSHHN